jgi:hypothetical protein
MDHIWNLKKRKRKKHIRETRVVVLYSDLHMLIRMNRLIRAFISFHSLLVSTSNLFLFKQMNQKCKVCGEPAAGFHFGAFTCEGCKVSSRFLCFYFIFLMLPIIVCHIFRSSRNHFEVSPNFDRKLLNIPRWHSYHQRVSIDSQHASPHSFLIFFQEKTRATKRNQSHPKDFRHGVRLYSILLWKTRVLSSRGI